MPEAPALAISCLAAGLLVPALAGAQPAGDAAPADAEEARTQQSDRAPDGDEPTDSLPALDAEVIEIHAAVPVHVDTAGEQHVSRAELLVAPGSRGDALDAIRNLAGIAHSSANTGSGDLAIRGTSGEDSVYLVDGVQIPMSMHFGNLQSVIPTEMIEEIELHPGGFGVEYGRATGGVVHIKTRPSDATHAHGFAELSFISAAGFANTPLWRAQNLSLAIGFRRSLIDLVLPAALPDDAAVTFDTPPYFHDGQLRIDWRPAGAHSVQLSLLHSTDRLALLVDQEDPHDREFRGQARFEDAFSRGLAVWRYRSQALDSTTVATVGHVSRAQQLAAGYSYDLQPRMLGAREDLVWRTAPWLTARAGLEGELVFGDVRANLPLPPAEGDNQHYNLTSGTRIDLDQPLADHRAGAYLALDARPVEPLTITPGVRLDHYHFISATTLSPRLLVAYQLTERTGLRASVGRYSRPLSLAEATAASLEPERATHYVVGIQHRLAPGVEASLSGFATRLEDLAVRAPDAMSEDVDDHYASTGTGHSLGGELMLKVSRERFFGWLAYTLSRSTRIDRSGMPERLFDHDQTHNLVLVGSYQWGGRGQWRLGGRALYATGTPYTPITGAVYLADLDTYQPVFGEPNSERIEAAHQIDVRIDRRFDFDSWSLALFLDVSNVYAHARVIGYSHSFDYQEVEEATDIPILPAVGVRGSF